MGRVTKPHPVKLIFGFIFNESGILKRTEDILRKHFGEIDFESQILDFTYTDHYEKEFGSGLKRKFISFKKLIPAHRLAELKITANSIENRLSKNNLRLINIDPGYLDSAKLILASTKDYKHRIYLGKGIYAEITLFYQDKTFQPWDWTYPDYRSSEYIAIFNRIRQAYTEQFKNLA